MATVGEMIFWVIVCVAAFPLTALVLSKKPCQDEVNITWGMRRDWARREREWN